MRKPIAAASAPSGSSGYSLSAMVGAARARMTFKPIVYGFANSRVHGMVSALLPDARMKELAETRTVEGIVETLERTPYKEDLVALSLRFKREELAELALGRHFARFARKLLGFTPEAGRGTLQALLARWDVHNLKTILLARKQHKKFEDVAPYLVLAGQLREEELKAMSLAEGTEALYAQLRTTAFGRDFLSRSPTRADPAQIKRMFLSMDKESAALEPLLGALDVYAYQLADESVAAGDEDAEAVRRMLRREADAKNFGTILRLMRAGAKPADMRHYIVPGGSLGKREWVAAAELGDVEKIVASVARRLPVLTDAMAEYKKRQSVSSFEIALANANARASLKAFHRSGVNLGVMVGALLLKETEMNNIRKVVRGKAQGLPDAEIQKMLVSVG